MKKREFSPYVVMGVVLAAYVVKVGMKLGVGLAVNSPVITGDGYHNISDMAEAVLVMAVIGLGSMKPDDFPFGIKKVESIFSLVVAALLVFMAFTVASHSLAGMLSYFPDANTAVRAYIPLPAHERLLFGPKYAPLVMGTALGSALISFFLGRWQVAQGKAGGHEAIRADGEETLSDGRIELTVFVGIAAEYLFGAPWIEYPLALFVAGLMLRTAWEIGWQGIDSLLMKSVGQELEDKIIVDAESLPGVVEVEKIKTFNSGTNTVIIMKVLSRAPLLAQRDLKAAIETRGAALVAPYELPEPKYYIRFAMPPEEYHRVAIAMRLWLMDDGSSCAVIADALTDADRLYVADVTDGEFKRVTEHEMPATPIDFLRLKRVSRLYCLRPTEALRTVLPGVEVETAPHWTLASLGF